MARILIVEDESLLRELFSRVLGEQGHEVVSTASVEEGMELCRARRPHLVIADWMLEGGGTGGDLARQVHRECPGTKVIVVTGHPGRSIFDDVDEPNVVGMLSKPIGIDELRKTIAAVLEMGKDDVEPDRGGSLSE
jgi:DNA-binding NtrC family response regulator